MKNKYRTSLFLIRVHDNLAINQSSHCRAQDR